MVRGKAEKARDGAIICQDQGFGGPLPGRIACVIAFMHLSEEGASR